MALHRYTTQAGSGGVAASVSVTSGAAKTLIQLVTPATRKAAVVEGSISFNSIAATDVPASVELLIQTTAGTATSITPDPDDPGMPAALVTAQHAFSAEPTASTIRRNWFVPVVGGLLIWQLPLDRELILAVSTRIGLRVTIPTSTISVRAYLVHEE